MALPISNYVNAVTQYPRQRVEYDGDKIPYVQSVDFTRAFDQSVAECTIVTAAYPAAIAVNNIDPIVVSLGYSNTVMKVFTGYVDDLDVGRFPNTWEIKCRDVLSRAVDTFLDDVGVEYNSVQAEFAITDLLSKAGLSVDAGTTNFTIGDIQPAKFKLVSIFDACQQICNLIGWRLWAGPDGTVYFQYQRPIPSENPIWNYQYRKNIKDYKYKTTKRNLRNRVIVLGYDTIRAAVNEDSPFIADPPKFITATISSELIDVQEMADNIAVWTLAELNHLQHSINMTVLGNPLLDVGRTIHVIDSPNDISADFFVFSAHGTMTPQSGFLYEIVALAPTDHISRPNVEPPLPDDDDDDSLPDEPPIDEPPTYPNYGEWRKKVYVATSLKGIFYTQDFTGPGGSMPTWAAINDGLDFEKITSFTGDPFRPDERQYCSVISGGPDSAVYRRELGGIWEMIVDADTLNNLLDFPFTVNFAIGQVVTDVNKDGWVGVLAGGLLFGNPDSGLHLFESLDYGETFRERSLLPTGIASSIGGVLNTGAFAGSYGGVGGQVFFVTESGSGSDGNTLLCSTDRGKTWSQIYGEWGWGVTVLMQDPYQDVAYWWAPVDQTRAMVTVEKGLWRSEDRGETFEQLLDAYVQSDKYALSLLFPGDGAKAFTLRVVTTETYNGGSARSVQRSDDGGVTWNVTPMPALLPDGSNGDSTFTGISVIYDAPEKLYLIGSQGSTSGVPRHFIGVTEDDGATIEGKAGTDRSSTTTTGIPFDGGILVSILQVWDQ